MKCLYCDRHLGFFRSGKGAFCSEQHEELYRGAAQRRLETPYASSAGTLDQTVHVEDLGQLLKATQTDRGVGIEAPVEMPAEVAMAADSLEAVAVLNKGTASSGTASSTNGFSEGASVSNPPPAGPPASIRAEEVRPLPDDPSALSFPFTAAHATPPDETDRRSEPRVNAIQMIKLATLRDPEREMTCALVNKSDTGIQFTAEADFAVGEILIADLPDQMVLTEVKHSQAKDGRYVIGAERVQTLSKEKAPTPSSGADRAEFLIKTLCERVRTGFADESGHETGAAGSDQRQRGLERVARILDIWQRTKSAGEPADKVDQPAVPVASVPAEEQHSSGAGRAFAAVAASLVIVGLLMVCIVEYRKSHAAIETAVSTPAPAPVSKQIAPEVKQPVVAQQVVAQQPQPVVAQHPQPVPPRAPAPKAPKAEPVPQARAAATGLHRAQIKAIEATWVGVSTDGNRIFGGMLAKGSTKELEYSKFAFLHTGNAAGVEITVDGQPVPMGKQPRLRLVELNASGFRFLRWSNDDPAQP
jgi:hypothetical protein